MADVNPSILIKIIWGVHFAFTTWAIMSGYLSGTPAYLLTQTGMLACGLWAVIAKDSLEALLMFLATLSFSVLNDILIISIYQPRADSYFENPRMATGLQNEYRWSLGMSIVNLLLKPVSIFILVGIYKSRSSGSEFNVNIPGLTSGLGQAPSNQASRGSYNTIESAQDSHPGIYGRDSHSYQSPQAPPPSYDYGSKVKSTEEPRHT